MSSRYRNPCFLGGIQIVASVVMWGRLRWLELFEHKSVDYY